MPVLSPIFGENLMDNWKYLVNTVGDLRFRQGDLDTMARVFEALSFVMEDKGANSEALVLHSQAQYLRASPAKVSLPSPAAADSVEDEEDDGDDDSDDGYIPRRHAPEEGSYDGLVSNLRWFMKKLT